MYSWKNKFKFGKSKDEKCKEKEKGKESGRSHSAGLQHGTDDAKFSMESLSDQISTDTNKDYLATSQSMRSVPTKESSIDAASSVSTFNDRHDKSTNYDQTAGDKKNDDYNYNNTSNSSRKSTSNDGNSNNNNPGDPSYNGNNVGSDIRSSQSHISNTSISSGGIMTVKVYNGDGFTLPFDIIANDQILTRLLSSGMSTDNSSINHEIDQLASQIDRVTLNNQGANAESLIPKDLSANFIPATIMLPGSQNPSPLLYFTIEFDNTVATIEPESGTMAQPVFNKISTFDITRKLPFLKFDVFARIPSLLLPSKAWQQEVSQQNYKLKEIFNKINSNQDIHLDSFYLPINLKFDSSANIRLYNHHWITLDNQFGKISITIDYKPSKNKSLSIDDFDLLKVIGKGSFGKVMQVKKKDTQKIYALKAIRKAYIVSKSEVTHTLAERTVLARVDCPFIVPLKFSFQSPEKLYLVLACINGGELFYHLQKEGRFDLSRARFYTAELLVALETLHNLDVIYRDLKPENILLDYQGHIALCDFGLCKLNMKDDDKTDTFCGTPEYLAPELLLGQGYSKVVDWWTLGVLLYEMLTGLPPYYDEDVPKMYKKILQAPLTFPDEFDKDAKDLLIGLLSRDPSRRLGRNGAHEIMEHPFFSQLSWKRLMMKGYIPPYKPPVSSAMDTSNFDQEFTKEKPIDSVVDEYLSESVQKQFGGWTYMGNEQLGSSMAQGTSIR